MLRLLLLFQRANRIAEQEKNKTVSFREIVFVGHSLGAALATMIVVSSIPICTRLFSGQLKAQSYNVVGSSDPETIFGLCPHLVSLKNHFETLKTLEKEYWRSKNPSIFPL